MAAGKTRKQSDQSAFYNKTVHFDIESSSNQEEQEKKKASMSRISVGSGLSTEHSVNTNSQQA